MASRCSWGLLLAAVLLGFLQPSSAFEVRNSSVACILANFSVQFIVEYNTVSVKQNSTFTLPSDAKVLPEYSTCGKGKETSQVLVIGFGSENSLKMTFVKNTSFYTISNLIFQYNLSDTTFFPNATAAGVREVAKDTDIRAALNTVYTCHNKNTINMGNVTVLLSNVTLEAYLANNNFSVNETICSEDRGPTPVAPTTASHTTTSMAPTMPPKTPDVGHYNVTGPNGTCLLASMGLQLNVTYITKNQTKQWEALNLPANTSFDGHCDISIVTLNLTSGSTSLIFNFAQNSSTEKYFLQRMTVSTDLPAEATNKSMTAYNDSLSALKATVGKSYKCLAEESIWVSSEASVNIFSVQVQAFKMSGDTFGAVEECQLDENNMLIPIIVGAALAGLVLIVLVAYLIGRKRSHAGYQTI
ncbi:lysosome-associated membrane glycoprotein 1 [Rhineura floridana]|uniref:lysosome-associated membrane glycoprotein 1 n=1 Tax=Rhineura floridana TaxID=261503 RepID=UPI002AC7F4BD|nr:lysosome-associated membrane glycoprotein 1 [Rhineura floridana]